MLVAPTPAPAVPLPTSSGFARHPGALALPLHTETWPGVRVVRTALQRACCEDVLVPDKCTAAGRSRIVELERPEARPSDPRANALQLQTSTAGMGSHVRRASHACLGTYCADTQHHKGGGARTLNTPRAIRNMTMKLTMNSAKLKAPTPRKWSFSLWRTDRRSAGRQVSTASECEPHTSPEDQSSAHARYGVVVRVCFLGTCHLAGPVPERSSTGGGYRAHGGVTAAGVGSPKGQGEARARVHHRRKQCCRDGNTNLYERQARVRSASQLVPGDATRCTCTVRTSALMPPPVMASATPMPDGTAAKKPATMPPTVPRDSIWLDRSVVALQLVWMPHGPKKGPTHCTSDDTNTSKGRVNRTP